MLISQARRHKSPVHFELANQSLKKSKALEQQVDDLVAELLFQEKQADDLNSHAEPRRSDTTH